MFGCTALALGAFVALAQSKAIIHNLCEQDVYVWSVPGNTIVNKALKPGEAYYEPFHQGTQTNPGIAVKVSSQSGGIDDGKDELDFSYTVDGGDSSKVWINLDSVRSNAFGENMAFYTCHGPYKTPYVPTRQCSIVDNIELVLCGTDRSSPPQDSSPMDGLTHCSTDWFEKRNSTEAAHRRINACHGRVGSPKRAVQPADKAGVKTQEQVKSPETKQLEKSRPKTAARKPKPEKSPLRPALVGQPDKDDDETPLSNPIKEHFDCFADAHGMHCDWNDKSLAKKIAKRDGDCWCHIITAWQPDINCTPQWVEDNYSQIWNRVCHIAGTMGVACSHVKAELESICPDPNQTPGLDRSHNATANDNDARLTRKAELKSPVSYPHKYAKACNYMVLMYKDTYKSYDCEAIASKIIQDHGKNEVNIEKLVETKLPKTSEDKIEKLFKLFWPKIKWDE